MSLNSVSGLGFDKRSYFKSSDNKAKVKGVFSFNYSNYKCSGYNYGGDDKGEASLKFKSFPVTVTVFSGQSGKQVFEKTIIVPLDNSQVPVSPSPEGKGSVYYNTVTQNVDLSEYDIRVPLKDMLTGVSVGGYISVKVGGTTDYVEEVSGFDRCYYDGAAIGGSLTVANKQHFDLDIVSDSWYNLPCSDGSGKAVDNVVRGVEHLVCEAKGDIKGGLVDESVDSLHFDVDFRLWWNALAAKSAYFDGILGSEPLARYSYSRFRYKVQIRFDKNGKYGPVEDLCGYVTWTPDSEDIAFPDYPVAGRAACLRNVSEDQHVSGNVYIGDLDFNESYQVKVVLSVEPDGYTEELKGLWKSVLGMQPVLPLSDFQTTISFKRTVKPLVLSTDAPAGRENRYWIYGHPDAELSLRLGSDGLKTGSYAAFFAGYGPLSTPFPGDEEPYECYEKTRLQSLGGTMLPDGNCSKSSALSACNAKRFEWFGDMNLSGKGCPYYCADYGSYGLYDFFVKNYVKKGEFSPGETYLRRFARPRNLLLRTKSFTDRGNVDFDVENIFRIGALNDGSDYAVDRRYHLRDFEFVVPAGESYSKSPNIKAGDEFIVSARRFMKRDNVGTPFDGTPEKSLFFCGVTPSMKWDADYPEDRSVFDDGAWSANYFTVKKDMDIYPDEGKELKFLVVPALRFDTLTTAERDSLYHCANAVYETGKLLEDDVIHLFAKNMSLDAPDGKSVVSRSDYGVQRYWEYSTEPASGKWKRVDTDEQLRQFFIDPKDLPWMPEKMKNDSDLWINSAVLLEQGVRTRKVLHFRQAAAVTRFTSDSESDLYSHRMTDGRYCVKVVSRDYYTIVAIPNINRDNIRFVSGGDDLYICYGDTIPAGQDSVVYTLQKGGDIATDRELVRLLDNNASFRAERVTRSGVSDITSGIDLRDRAAHVRLQYYQPPREKAPEDGDTIVYRFYVSSCRNVVMDSIRIITYPHDRLSIDSIAVEDGYIASKDAFGDTILVRAKKGTSPKVLVKGADVSNYRYMWHKRTTIDDYPGMMPLPYAQYVPYWSDEQLVDLSRVIGLECDSNSVNKYYNLYYEIYSIDMTHPEFGGFVTRTNFDSPYVTTAQRRAYCYFIINEVNACRAEKAVRQYEMDNSWTGFTSQGSDRGDLPWVRLTPHEKYLEMDENFFFIRREGRYGSPCGQDCPSDSIKVTVRYYSALKDNVISYMGADSIVVLYNEKVDRIDGTPTTGGYGDPATSPDIVSRRYMWEITADTLSGVWQRIENIDGMGNDFLQQPYGETAEKYCNLPKGILVSKGGQVFLRRVVWSVLDSDLDSRIESVSNVFRIVSARLLDEGDLVHNSKPGMKDISLCPDASDFIVVCEPEENIDHNSRYVWNLRYDDGTEVPHIEFSDNHDYVRHRDNPQYPDLNNAVTVDNVSEDYTVSVYRIDAVTGMFSDTVVSRVHVWRMEPEFLYATAADGFGTWHTTDNPLLTVSSGTLTRLRAAGVVEDEDESLRLWTLQVQDFVKGQETMGYRSLQASPYLYLYNPGANRIALHAENMHGCKADVEGSVYVSGYAGERASAFVPDDDDMYSSWGVPSDLKGSLVSLYPTVTVTGGVISVVSADEDYDIVVTDETGRAVLSLYGVSGNVTFAMNVGRGIYNAAVGSHVFRIFVK